MQQQHAGASAPDATHHAMALRDAAGATLRLVLDDSRLSTMERLALVRELAQIRKALGNNPTTMERLKLARQLAEVRKKLGAATPAPAPTPPGTIDDPAEDIAAGRRERQSTSKFYDYDPNRKPAQRKRENAEAMALLRAIDAGELKVEALTDEQRMALAKYSGTGGNLVGADGKKGSAYEYYTPKPIAEGMWKLLAELGFKGGRTLDPSSGVGIFSATAPVNAAIDAVELNETSGRVNQIVNDGPGHSTTIAPFEQFAAATPDEQYDAVITNVPFGGVEDRGGNQLKDTKYRNEPLQNYFILRSLEKLRPGGLAAFITPPRCVSGKGGKEQDLRQAVSFVAEFMGAYRLPNSVFGTAQADTITDVIVFRKFDRPTLDKIAELREQNPGLLVEANVCWPEFIEGRYFAGEGRRFILGEFKAKDPTKFRDVDRVINDGSMTDIAKLLRKFGDSRIRWDLLEAAETSPIVYRDGDTLHHAGQTLQMQDGRWVVIQAAGDEAGKAEQAELLARLTTPLGAVNAGISYSAAVRFQAAMQETAQALLVPDWLRGLLAQLLKVPADGRDAAWGAATVGLAVNQAIEERQAEETGFNYLEGYPALSEAMQRVVSDAKRPPSMLSQALKTAMKSVTIHYDKAAGFSGLWRGDVAADVDNRSESQRFEAARYQAGGGTFVPIDEARRLFGDGFDPMGSDDWCVSADGRGVAKADDYYLGNYADFLERINADIAAATDPAVRAKLIRQKLAAESRLLRADPSAMDFTLFSPFVTVEERAEFLRRFVDPRFAVGFDEETGKPGIIWAGKEPVNVREKLLKRLALHLNGSRLTLGGADVGDEKKALAELRNMAATAEAQFNSWVKANPIIMGRLADVANDPQRIYFKQVEDESPLDIPGLNPEWTTHGYQNAWVRKMGREFGGINGDGVGLGKTSQGLIAVQHAHSIGVKKRTVMVVPNAVLSNWRKEAMRVYASIDDCLFVGLREAADGTFKTDPSAYDADLNRILENRHRKVFMTYEAFARLRLRASTAEAYDAYLASVDLSYANSDSKKDDEKKKSRRALLIEQLTTDKSKSMAAPFFEDLGVDSLLIDEAHFLKNSRATVEFSGGKFLSLAEPSARGLDAQAKAWYVRKQSPRKDGVILLTATPITNSPLEIYSMLALAMGDQKLNDLMNGIKGADQFMEVMCQMENRDEETLDGKIKPYDVFVGLNNVDVLRNALQSAITARTAEQVGAQIVVPTADELPTPVHLPKAVNEQLVEYKQAFRWAIDTLMEKDDPGGSEEAFNRVAARFGEPIELIGHPFNLINKMSMLIADPELDQRATFYVISPAQADRAATVVDKWNAKAPVEDRPRPGPHTDKVAVVGSKKVKDGDDFYEVLRIQVRAKVVDSRIVLDTMVAETISAFEALADKEGLELDVTVPPKLAAMIENYQREEANPRGRVAGMPSGRVRQLIFCDVLAMHPKIKRLVNRRCGVAAGSIAIITGKVNGKPEEILAVQDGFNAEGDENRYRCVIANEKAEVGINLQKGTQAIHHLTLGWTPDSLTQRNGRGVRQGNETQRVTVYHYDADGTFDSYKRMLVGKKSDWIGSVMDPDGGNKVAVSGGMSREQLETLIDSVGDADAMSRIQARAQTAERLAREASTQGRQAITVQTIQSQRAFMGKYPDALAWAADKLAGYVKLREQADVIRARLANPKATPGSVVKNQNLLAELEARLAGTRRRLDEALTIKLKARRYGSDDVLVDSNLDDFMRTALQYKKARQDAAELVSSALRRPYGYTVEVNPGSELSSEWQSEIDLAKSMVDESKRDFEKLAKDPGGISPAVLARVDAGEAAVIDGKVVCAGAFVESADGLAVVVLTPAGLVAQYLSEDAKVRRVSVADEARKAKLILPGAEGYDAAITRAAKIEDAVFATRPSIPGDRVSGTFSYTVPEVAQRRTATVLARYQVRGYGCYLLPPPHFPAVLVTPLPDGARVTKLIAEQQAAIVKGFENRDGTDYFLTETTASITKSEGSSFPWEAAIDVAKAAGLRFTHVDFEVMNKDQYDRIERKLLNESRAPFSSVLEATDLGDLEQRAMAWLRDEALPHVDLDTLPNFNLVSFLESIDFSLGYKYQATANRLRAAAAAPAPAPGGGTPAPTPAPEDTDTDPMRIVGITGNTKAWKDQIKAAASMAGGRAIWDGDATCWNVPFAGWTRLIASYPRAEQELNVVESSGKTSYGGRRRYR